MPTPHDPSPAAHPTIAALVVDARMRARLADAVAPPARLLFARRVGELRELSRRRVDLVVVEPADALGVDVVPTVRWLRATYPPLPVVAYCAPDQSTSLGALRLARAGVSQLLIRDLHDTPLALHSALATAGDAAASDLAATALRDVVPQPAWPIVEHCLRAARAAPSVHALADALGMSRQALAARLRAAGLPSPRRLIFWSRLLVAMHRLEQPGCTAERAALDLGFPSDAAFHNAVRRHTGRSVGELRRAGGFAHVLGRLRRLLSPRVAPDDAGTPRD